MIVFTPSAGHGRRHVYIDEREEERLRMLEYLRNARREDERERD
jgi:hypothetical protein